MWRGIDLTGEDGEDGDDGDDGTNGTNGEDANPTVEWTHIVTNAETSLGSEWTVIIYDTFFIDGGYEYSFYSKQVPGSAGALPLDAWPNASRTAILYFPMISDGSIIFYTAGDWEGWELICYRTEADTTAK